MLDLALCLSAYIVTYMSAIYMRKNEVYVSVAHACILLFILGPIHGLRLTLVACLIGAIMATAEFVCVYKYRMWQYNHVRWHIPLWLPFTWAIVALFVYDVMKKLKIENI